MKYIWRCFKIANHHGSCHCNLFYFLQLFFMEQPVWTQRSMSYFRKKVKTLVKFLQLMLWTSNTCHDAKIQLSFFSTHLLGCMRRRWYSVLAASSCGDDSTANQQNPSGPTTQPRPVLQWKPVGGQRSWSALICWGYRLSSQPWMTCPLAGLSGWHKKTLRA